MAAPLRPLPLPVALLACATSEYNRAESCHHVLSKRPSDAQLYASTYAAHARSIDTACHLLRTAIATGSGALGSGRLELRARLMLVEILFVSVGTPAAIEEAESVVAKGVAIAASYPQHHATLLHQLYAWQARLYAQSQPKFAKTILKRAITDAMKMPQLRHVVYGHSLLYVDVCEKSGDETGAMNMLQDLERNAIADGELVVAATAVLRTAIVLSKHQRQWPSVISILSRVTDPSLLPSDTRIAYFLLLALAKIQVSEPKEAKDALKTAHELLDAAPESRPPDEEDGTCAIRCKTGTVTLTTMPRSILYALAFLISVVVHRDAFGTKPKALLFASEGLRAVDTKLTGSEGLPVAPPLQIYQHAAFLARVKAYLHLFSAELSIMRSGPADHVLHDLSSALAAVQSLSPSSSSQVEQRALLDYAVSNYPSETSSLLFESLASEQGSPDNDETISSLAAVMVLLDAYASSQSMSDQDVEALSDSLSSFASSGSPEGPIALQMLSALIPSLAQFATDRHHLHPASTAMAGAGGSTTPLSTATGTGTGTIIGSKTHLASALALANKQGHSHSKALCLALLSNLFLWTNNDQALKMLGAAYNLTKGMGPRTVVPNDAAEAKSTASVNEKDRMVGNARLGLWIGERLLAIYEKGGDVQAVAKQQLANQCHRAVLGI